MSKLWNVTERGLQSIAALHPAHEHECNLKACRPTNRAKMYAISHKTVGTPSCTATILCCCHFNILMQVLSFRETISVPESVTDAVLKCEVSFTADSGELARQVITINTGLSASKQQGMHGWDCFNALDRCSFVYPACIFHQEPTVL